MKFTIIITLVMIALVGFVGVVSAEVGIVNYDYNTLLSDTTDSCIDGNGITAKSVIEAFHFDDITDYPDVISFVMGVENNYNAYDAIDIKSNVECSFTAKIDGNVIGDGWYSAYRTCTEQASSKAVITYEFDSWDVSGYSGAKDVYITYSDNNERLSCIIGYIGSYPEIPDSNGKVRVFGRTKYYSNWYTLYYINGVITVYQKVDFNQKMSYFYEPYDRSLDINFNRNGYVNFVNVTNQLDKVLLSSKSGDDMKLHFQNITYVLVTVENPFNGETYQNKIPLSIPYDVLMPESPAGNVSLLPSYVINTSYYRGEILGIPVIGNMSYGYLDFIDSVSDDTYAMGINLLDTLLYPVHVLNDYMSRAIDTISAVVNDAINAVDVLIQPMVSIVNAIPFKVMNVFLFTLCLDILRVLLAWRV